MSGNESVSPAHAALVNRLASLRGPTLIAALAGELGRLLDRIEMLEAAMRAHDLAASLQEAAVIASTVPEPVGRVRTMAILPTSYMDPSLQLHQLEYFQDGRPFRWSGPGQTLRFLLPLDRTVPLQLSLAMFHFTPPGRRLPLTLAADGQLLARIDTPEQLLTVVLPPEGEGEGRAFTEVAISTADCIAAGIEDPRRIGFGFIELRITEA